MENLRSPNKLRVPVGIVLALGSISVLAGCAGSHELLADKSATILSKSESQDFVTAQESGGYPHYESVYDFILKQCGRIGDADADKDGCVELSIGVDQKTYNQFNEGDTIVFDSTRTGYLVPAK
jgi:hypothetical protein